MLMSVFVYNTSSSSSLLLRLFLLFQISVYLIDDEKVLAALCLSTQYSASLWRPPEASQRPQLAVLGLCSLSLLLQNLIFRDSDFKTLWLEAPAPVSQSLSNHKQRSNDWK